MRCGGGGPNQAGSRREADEEQTRSRRGADEKQTRSRLEQSLAMCVSNRETEASMRDGGQKDQSDGYGSKADLGSDWPRDGMASRLIV